jgi:hypothetical protein
VIINIFLSFKSAFDLLVCHIAKENKTWITGGLTICHSWHMVSQLNTSGKKGSVSDRYLNNGSHSESTGVLQTERASTRARMDEMPNDYKARGQRRS